MRTARGRRPALRDDTHVCSVNNSVIFEIVMFTTYNCNLLLQFQVFDNVSRKENASRVPSSLVPSTKFLISRFFSLIYTRAHTNTHIHTRTYACTRYSVSLILFFFLLFLSSLQRYVPRVARESQGIGGWKRQI